MAQWNRSVSASKYCAAVGRAVLAVLLLLILGLPAAGPRPSSVSAQGTAVPCSSAGTWTQGEVTVYFFDVEQGDSQLIVGPTGRTLLIDLGETTWNSTGSNTNASRIAAKIRQICGTGSKPVALDYVMASHHHLDHTGYARNPTDMSNLGNGLYQLLTPSGLGFAVGTLIDRDGGVWQDSNADGRCQVGTSSSPANEIAWHNVGHASQTARRWICWLYGPAGQADRAIIQGQVLRLVNSASWPFLDLGPGVTVAVVNANGKDTRQADGVTPVSGDHTAQGGDGPPNENDYSIGVRVGYGNWRYATAGDSDGEYSHSSQSRYTYNDIEAKLGPLFGNVDTLRANHHGSGHSSSQVYLDTLKPETVFVSCGNNNYGHPSNRVLNALRTLANDRGIGADIYLANNPCDSLQSPGTTPTNYAGVLNTNGDVVLRTTGSGTGYTVAYSAGSRSYTAYGSGGLPLPAVPSSIKINEYLMAPSPNSLPEWVELFNPTAGAVDIGGLYIDDVAGSGASPKLIPVGTVIPAGGYRVIEFASGFLNNTGAESVRFLKMEGGVETVYDQTAYNLPSSQYGKVFHRMGDGGPWCATISSNVTKNATNPATCP